MEHVHSEHCNHDHEHEHTEKSSFDPGVKISSVEDLNKFLAEIDKAQKERKEKARKARNKRKKFVQLQRKGKVQFKNETKISPRQVRKTQEHLQHLSDVRSAREVAAQKLLDDGVDITSKQFRRLGVKNGKSFFGKRSEYKALVRKELKILDKKISNL